MPPSPTLNPEPATMSTNPSQSRFRKAHLLAIIFAAGAALLVTGAFQVTREMKDRPRRCFELHRQWQNWSQMMLTSVPGAGRQEWSRLSEENPMLLLEACALNSARPAGRTP